MLRDKGNLESDPHWVSDNCEVEPESISIDDRLPISSRVEVPRRCQTVLMR